MIRLDTAGRSAVDRPVFSLVFNARVMRVLDAEPDRAGALALLVANALPILALLGRDFLGRRLADQYSAATLVEVPVRIAVVWFVVLMLLAPAYVVMTVLALDHALVGWGFLAALVGAKRTVDRALLRLRYDSDPGRVTRWFRPNYFHSG